MNGTDNTNLTDNIRREEVGYRREGDRKREVRENEICNCKIVK